MRSFIAFLIFTTLAIPAAAQQWTVDDILLAETGSAMELSRDGKLAVWVKSKMDKKKGTSVSQIMLRNLAEDFEVQLTRGKESSKSPRFSPDGSKIAFLTSRPDAEADEAKEKPESQVWILDVRGGEPSALTSFEKGVKEVNWIDNKHLLVTAAEDPSLYEQQSKERKDTSDVVDDEEHAPPVRLFKFALEGKKPERLTENTDRITSTVVSDDGAWAVTIHERSLRFEYDEQIRPVTFLHDLKGGTAKQLFAGTKLLPRQVQFTPDNLGFYFATPFANHPVYLMAATTHLYYYDIAAGRETRVNLDWDKDLGGGYDVSTEGLIALLADGVRYKPALYKKNGGNWSRTWVTGEHEKSIFDVEWSRDGKTLLYTYTTASVPGQWYAAKFAAGAIADAKPITKLNTHIEKKAKARTEIVTWTGAKDEQVEGILYYPHNYEAGKKYPLVLMIHGGPHGTDMDSWEERWGYPHQLFAQRGAFILTPNYHGSGNYGLEWGESITGGQYNELEWIDCERGVDSLIAKGMVDPDKLGTMGWSNGSIITIELTTRTTRYKAASAGAGDVNWISDWGNCQFGHSFDDLYLGTTPLADPEFYIKKSPLFRMDKVVTPTIIYFGTIDRQVPTEQGWQHYRALQHLGKTDTKFILFPGEAHGPRQYGHQHRKLTTELEWFDKYLFKNAAAKNEAMKPGSPLAAALKLKSAGDIPETVPRNQLAIGRFEVTRDQYAAFKSGYSYPAGTGAYPANGISFEDAKAYCEWLSKKTGTTYRLGTEKEMAEHLKPSAKENTLDAWAGYEVNLDDAAKLAGSVAQLGPGALLKPVGSSAGSGDDPIYDLGGNVAEWVVAEDGSGKALGGSADRPADAKSNGPASAAFTGFRVVRGL